MNKLHLVMQEATAQATKDNAPAEHAGTEAMDCGPTANEEGLSQSKEVSIEGEGQAENKRPSELKKGATPGNLLGGSPALLFGDESAVGM